MGHGGHVSDLPTLLFVELRSIGSFPCCITGWLFGQG